ncbi:polysaccharide pyruvyl transferase family protein [Bizionia saleffrena]|uniref:Polysaccharide pyruvyl transferase family protein n=1 Tax=Bizionia saleffrena TaxID=291189 RepID=A0A8H2LFM5_9FLAO|nr:polysaccharide pyruvyl transferase family protein [Bizionia saleffrena]TYB80160.1 polysaccharide pyruvyl transferase family protein [Bizionia saleffrena]
MLSNQTLRLFWWNEKKLQGKIKENYGDLLGLYLAEKISGKRVVWVNPSKFSIANFFKSIYVTIGSILTHATPNCIVWGSGIISKDYKIKNAEFLAVRGPQTRKHLLEHGYNVPEVYGDPALLLPKYYHPKIKKEFTLGIVPHYNDFKLVNERFQSDKSVVIIDLMTNDIEATTNQFLKCETIVSSSLHGVIVAHAYGIPAVWQKFSNDVFGDDIKYQDYFESVALESYSSSVLGMNSTVEELKTLINEKPNLPKQEMINGLCDGLMRVCPFKKEVKND